MIPMEMEFVMKLRLLVVKIQQHVTIMRTQQMMMVLVRTHQRLILIVMVIVLMIVTAIPSVMN